MPASFSKYTSFYSPTHNPAEKFVLFTSVPLPILHLPWQEVAGMPATSVTISLSSTLKAQLKCESSRSCPSSRHSRLRSHIAAYSYHYKSENWKLLSHVWLFVTPWDCSPPGSLVHGIFQARILEWVAIPFSRDWTWVFCFAGRFFTIWATREAHSYHWDTIYYNNFQGFFF